VAEHFSASEECASRMHVLIAECCSVWVWCVCVCATLCGLPPRQGGLEVRC